MLITCTRDYTVSIYSWRSYLANNLNIYLNSANWIHNPNCLTVSIQNLNLQTSDQLVCPPLHLYIIWWMQSYMYVSLVHICAHYSFSWPASPVRFLVKTSRQQWALILIKSYIFTILFNGCYMLDFYLLSMLTTSSCYFHFSRSYNSGTTPNNLLRNYL
jgi:hypothetical protein